MMIHEYSPLGTSRDETDRALVRPASMKSMPTLRSTTIITTTIAMAPGSHPRMKRVRRIKSFSESGAQLDKTVPNGSARARTRPFSAGDVEEIRRVTVTGFSKNAKGVWLFTIDVGSDEYNSYGIRRRFTDFKELYEGVANFASGRMLPELPNHGLYSVFQMLISPEKTLTLRAQRLQEILQAINAHPVLSTSIAFTKFIGKNPSSLEVGYVSLSGYNAPSSDRQFRLSSSSHSLRDSS